MQERAGRILRQRNEDVLVNPEAERALIGRLVANESIWYDVSDSLGDDDFGLNDTAAIFRAVAGLIKAGTAVNIPALVSFLGRNKSLDAKSIGSRLSSFTAMAREPEYARIDTLDLVRQVKQRSICRSLVTASDGIRELAEGADPGTRPTELIANAAALVNSCDTGIQDDPPTIGELVGAVVSAAEAARKSGKPVGIKTRFRAFSDLVGPLLPTQLVVVAGETGSGKTALVTGVALDVAEQGIPVDMFSLEQDGAELATRLISMETSISSDCIFDGAVTEDDTLRMLQSGQRFVGLPLRIDSRPRQSVDVITARVARGIATRGVKLAVIDHLQYVNPDNPKQQENQQVKQVVDGLKEMAKRLRIAVIVISHISRHNDEKPIQVARDISRPVLKQLYGSSAIEKAADAVVFVHRPYWYLERISPPSKDKIFDQYQVDLERWRDRAELVLPKRRGGTGFATRECIFDAEKTRFSDLPDGFMT